ncbi:ABC transporter ATP-binding protein [Cellulomonas sp. 179-A 4D5 NHS]|uniref:ABC transporter ATP-binding protein n=1 Tax=Cellulomonas sp. 179-A 4D5 NHS TaxID=3142378 RepID=UPI0039A25DF2
MPPATTGHPGPVPQSTPHDSPGVPRLSARGVVKRFGATTALAGVDVDVAAGETLAVMGPSGSGKSTLLHCLAGILAPDAGTVRLGGTDIGTLNERERSLLRRRRLGFVFQFGQLLSELPAVENVALPLMLQGVGRAEATRRAAAWLGSLGLAGKEGRRPGELSGGEAQRVAVARALVTGPEVVFADEPTGALDQATGADVMRALTGATAAAGASLVLVTHDEQVAAWCSRRIHVRDGHVTDGSVQSHAAAQSRAAAASGVPAPAPGVLASGTPTSGGPR